MRLFFKVIPCDYVPRHEDVLGSGYVGQRSLDLRTKWQSST